MIEVERDATEARSKWSFNWVELAKTVVFVAVFVLITAAAFKPDRWAQTHTTSENQANILAGQGWEPYAVTPIAHTGFSGDALQTWHFRKKI